MASRDRGRRRLDKRNSSLMFLQMTPPHGWKEDSHSHYLRLTLPGFKTNDVTIHMDKYGHLVIRGDRQVSDHKYISFEETFEVPLNADIEDASATFEDDQVYCVTIPKKQQQKRTEEKKDTIPKEKKNPKDILHPKPYDDFNSFYTKKIAVLMVTSALLAVVLGLIVKFRHE